MAAGATTTMTTKASNEKVKGNDEPSSSSSSSSSVTKVKVQYQITVRTSDRAHADTACKVFVVLHGTGEGLGGEDGTSVVKFPTSTGAIPLVTPLDDHKKPFRRGAESVFMVQAHDVGTIIGCRIGHSAGATGRLGDWNCAGVAVTETVAGETAAFPCNQWWGHTVVTPQFGNLHLTPCISTLSLAHHSADVLTV